MSRPCATLMIPLLALSGCSSDEPETGTTPTPLACDAEPVVLTTAEGVPFVRTPDSCFENLPDWPYAPQYVEIDGLRQAYVDEGPSDGPVVLLLHGQPSWSYLYRKMIPVLVDGGYRVIAMDHLGMGRSDKPTELSAYSYLGHADRLTRFIEILELRDIHLFVQDWGSLLGLRVAGLHPERFARIAVGNGMLPVVPAGVQPYPDVEDPDVIADIPSLFAAFPAQQIPFYDGCDFLLGEGGDFGAWIEYAMTARSFVPSEVLEALTWFDLPDAEAAAYDAPFPSRVYMGGPRTFPSLVNELPGLNADAWAGLEAFERPFITIWGGNDPGNLGACETQQQLVAAVPGASGQPHVRLPEASHFLQDDQGAEIARRLVAFYGSDPLPPLLPHERGSRYCEILLVRMASGGIEAEVWGTQRLNTCPQEAFDALDTDAIQQETGALQVVLNHPRYWIPDSTVASISTPERRTFGDLEMFRLATVQLGTDTSTGAYTERTVLRDTTYRFLAGRQIYELVSPEATYVMQSQSTQVDPSLRLEGLPDIGDRLSLPEGWRYVVRTLAEDLVLGADGAAVVLQDDLLNTYQRVTPGEDPGGQSLPVLPDGTGTMCTSDADCSALDADQCLSVMGTGFCTVEGCAAGSCGAPYVCCYDCNPDVAAFLPFDGSACIPQPATTQLTGQAGCTCE